MTAGAGTKCMSLSSSSPNLDSCIVQPATASEKERLTAVSFSFSFFVLPAVKRLMDDVSDWILLSSFGKLPQDDKETLPLERRVLKEFLFFIFYLSTNHQLDKEENPE